MTITACNWPTTYSYEPLRGSRYIRLLHIDYIVSEGQQDAEPIYALHQHELSDNKPQTDFEAISYTWGEAQRVSALKLQNDQKGDVGLTANLTEALPHLARQSKTKRLWIDQICINQSDNQEKAVQIGLMAEIYKRAACVLIWLGSEDENIRICRQWLKAIEELIPTLESAEKITRGSPTYNADTRGLFLASTFYDATTDPMFTPAIQQFWLRPWFTRGWICQEFLLAREVLCLVGDFTFTLMEVIDLFSVPEIKDNKWMSYRSLMWLKQYPFTDPPPRNYLRMLSAIAGQFDTKEFVDRLFGCLGLMDGLNFVPDYMLSIQENFTRFAVTLAQDYGSLDFLSLWAANLDPLVPDTPAEVLGFPSWVPSWTPWPLTAPFRLATGGARQYRNEISWNAAGGRKHVHAQEEDAVATRRLHVRGKIIDYIDAMSSTKFARYWDVDEEYLDSLVDEIKSHLPGLESWTHKDLIHFLHIASFNGDEPRIPQDELFGSVENSFRDMTGRTDALGVCLTMGRGRRFVKTENGRLGLAPAIGSRAKADGTRGSAIAIIHGCTVPVVLEASDERGLEWRLIGDSYVEGIMLGAAVDWKEEDAQTFVLV